MSFKKKGVEGVKWTFFESITVQGFAFVTTIILTRILLPDDFGLIGIIMVFLAISRAIIQGGLGTSLIQDNKADERDFSTVFIANCIASVLLYFILFMAAPWISLLFEEERITPVLRVLSLSLVISAASSIQAKILMKTLAFKKLTILRLPGIICGSVAAIICAYQGMSYWSLVVKELVTKGVDAIMLWSRADWTPRLVFDTKRFRYHFDYGYKLMLTSILNVAFTEIYALFIGKMFSLNTLGFYNRANRFMKLPRQLLIRVVTKPTFPLLSKIKDDNERVTAIYRQMMRAMFFVVAPGFVILAVIAKPLFVILLTERWIASAEYFSILCLAAMLYPVQSLNLNVFKVYARTDMTLKLAVFRKFLIIGVVIVGYFFGMNALLWGMVASNYVAFFINTWYSKEMIRYGPWQQVKDLFATWALSIGIGIGGYHLLDYLPQESYFIQLLVVTPAMILAYLLLNYLIRNQSMNDFYALAKPFVTDILKKRRK